jgi:hypothetical protein
MSWIDAAFAALAATVRGLMFWRWRLTVGDAADISMCRYRFPVDVYLAISVAIFAVWPDDATIVAFHNG